MILCTNIVHYTQYTGTHKYEAASMVEQQPHLSLESQKLGHARDGHVSKVEKELEEALIQARCE